MSDLIFVSKPPHIKDEPTKYSCKRCGQVIMFKYTGTSWLGGHIVISGYKYCDCGPRKATKHQQKMSALCTNYKELGTDHKPLDQSVR